MMLNSVYKLLNLDGCVSVVTGGAGYLGKAMAETLAEMGCVVYIAGRTEEKCKNVAEEISEKYNAQERVRFITVDISNSSSIKKCFDKIVQECGKIDILINNAFFCAGNELEKMTDNEWDIGINGSINSVFRCMKNIIPIMQKNKHGSIINIASMYGVVSPDPGIYEELPFGNPPNYGAGKAGVIQLTKYAACYLAKDGIRVNSISPGPFPNEEVQKHGVFMERLSNKVPLGRVGLPHELKGVISLLASDASSFITGANIPVDGGWTSW